MDGILLSAREFNTLINSSAVGFFTALISTIIGVWLSFVFFRFDLRFKKIWETLLLVPLLIPPYVHALTWQNLALILSQSGFVDHYFTQELRTIPGVIFVLALSYFPIPFYLTLNSLRAISQDVTDAGRLLMPEGKNFLRLTLRQVMPTITAAFLIVFILAFSSFDVPAFFEVNVFITEIFSLFSASYDYRWAILLSMVPVILTSVLWLIVLRIYWNKPFFSTRSVRDVVINQMSRIDRVVVRTVLLCLVGLSIVIPLVSIVNGADFGSRAFIQDIAVSEKVIADTAWIAFISAVSIPILSALVYFLVYRYFWGRLIILSFFALPAVTFGIIFIYLFNQGFMQSVYGSWVILLIAYFLRFFPIVCEIFFVYSKHINPQIIESLKLLKKPGVAYLSILLPVFQPALILSMIAVFWLVATELPITLLLQPGGFQTLTSRLFIFLHYGSAELMNILTLVLIVMCIFPVLAIGMMMKSINKN